MRATTLAGLLKPGDRVAVSNITGREAAAVTAASQKYCGNIVGGWALGKGGQSLDVPGGQAIPVFSTAQDLMNNASASSYSPTMRLTEARAFKLSPSFGSPVSRRSATISE